MKRVVLASSIGVYGSASSLGPVSEHAPLLAKDVYGASKIAAECAFRAYAASFSIEGVAIRVSSIYGPGRNTSCLIKELLTSRSSGNPVKLPNRGQSPRQLIHIDDAVDAFVRAATAARFQQFAYNISGGSWVTEAEVARIVQQRMPKVRWVVSEETGDAPDGDIGPLDFSAAMRDLGYVPRITLQSGLGTYMACLAETLIAESALGKG